MKRRASLNYTLFKLRSKLKAVGYKTAQRILSVFFIHLMSCL